MYFSEADAIERDDEGVVVDDVEAEGCCAWAPPVRAAAKVMAVKVECIMKLKNISLLKKEQGIAVFGILDDETTGNNTIEMTGREAWTI